eukprot:tig00020553_g10557.t1
MFDHDSDRYAPSRLIALFCHGKKSHPDEQVVVLMKVLADETANFVNAGYENQTHAVVKAVNGAPLRNLRHLVDLVGGTADRFICLDLEFGHQVVIEAEAGRRATPTILARYRVRADRSDDLAPAPAPAAPAAASPDGSSATPAPPSASGSAAPSQRARSPRPRPASPPS